MTEGGGSFPYRRIVDDLRAEIAAGRRAPGERLPSEHDLAAQYAASRPTVRRAIAVLKAEGLVVSEQGRGMFVRSTPHVRLLLSGANYRKHRNAGLPGFNAQVREQGQVPEQRLLDVITIPASSEIAQRLNLAEDEQVVVRKRLFMINGQPVAFCDSYYAEAMVRGTAITQLRRIKGGVNGLIEDSAGPIRRRLARSVDELSARMPSRNELDGLQLATGVPVVDIVRTVYDTNGNPVEVQHTVAAADRHQFQYEVSMT
ncbi:GntR family transcriptional regulator [Amycolatopsis sp. NPDC058986]|uniref:GntR family transcriptional regulator n=1 Tax=unclassified Amycolatopsis TaxID=2618356 RepID=UPI00366F9A7C